MHDSTCKSALFTALRVLPARAGGKATCDDELSELQLRFGSQAEELQRVRKKCLPA